MLKWLLAYCVFLFTTLGRASDTIVVNNETILERVHQLERKIDTLEVKIDKNDEKTSEVLGTMRQVAGGFITLIVALVIFNFFRADYVAKTEAKKEFKKEFENYKAEFETLLSEGKKKIAEIEELTTVYSSDQKKEES
jgi:chaperonin cofactor prefoldin